MPGRASRRSGRSGIEALTARELEVLELTAAGLRSTVIADELQISLATVKTHLHHIFTKLDVTTRVEAAKPLSRSPPRAPADDSSERLTSLRLIYRHLD